MSNAENLTLKSSLRLSSGYSIPRLGLGVFQNQECRSACLAALKTGYIHIDSAQVYRNEKVVGDAIREYGIKREDVFITTKIVSGNHGYESGLSGVDRSLAAFGFDYIDLFLIHDPLSGKEKRVATYRALLEAKKQGKIRTVGVSNYSPKHLEEIRAAGLEQPAVNQVELHPFCQQKPIVEYCEKHGIVIEAYCPLVRGKFGEPVLQDISKKHAKDPAQVLVRWSLQRGFVPLPKSAHPNRVESNANVYDFELDADDMKRLNGLDKGKAGAISWNPVDAE